MPIALSMPLLLSGIRTVMRYRDRVDRVLSLSTAAEGLPFALPRLPADMKPFREEMRLFFRTEEGRMVLVLRGLEKGFEQWDGLLSARKDIAEPGLQKNFDECTDVYRQARSIGPYLLQPQLKEAAMLEGYAATGPGDDARLAYFIVESDRLSRNSALARILLVTADTLLEFLGENASTFIANPRSRVVVEGLLEEFAGKRDFDDESAREIFRNLLGSAITVVLEHPELVPNKPLLGALYGAINDVRKEVKDKTGNDTQAQDILTGLFGENGLERIGRFFLAHVAADASLVADGDVARRAVKAALTEIVASIDAGGSFSGIFSSPAARNRVLEALVEVAAGRAGELLAHNGRDGKPFSTAVLKALVASIGTEAGKRELFGKIASGDVAGDLYKVALAATSANIAKLGDETGIKPLVGQLIAALADELVALPAGAKLGDAQRDKLVSAALQVLARQPGVLTGERKFASALVGAALQAAAVGAADGFDREDLEAVLDAALVSAGDNAALAGFGESQAAAINALTRALAAADLPSLRKSDVRRQMLLDVVAALNANPKVWSSEEARRRLGPLVEALMAVVKTGHARQLLSDAAAVGTFRMLLLAASRRAKGLIARDASVDLKDVLLKAVDLAEEELGHTVDQDTIPLLLERVALAYLKDPFALAQAAVKVKPLLDAARVWLETR